MFFVTNHKTGFAVVQPAPDRARPVLVSTHPTYDAAECEADGLNLKLGDDSATTAIPADLKMLLDALN